LKIFYFFLIAIQNYITLTQNTNSSLTQNTHSFHSFVRYNNEITLARSKARFADLAAANNKKTKKRRAAAASANPDPDPSVYGEDVTQQHSSSSESEFDETPLGVLLAEPCRPKDDPDASTMKEIESLSVLQLFKAYYTNLKIPQRK
jgi:hypothetical protein